LTKPLEIELLNKLMKGTVSARQSALNKSIDCLQTEYDDEQKDTSG
jgi:hypothetical protein